MKRKKKAEENIKAAKTLIEATYYAPSVHVSYYGSFLLLKYICNKFLSLPYSEQEDPHKAKTSHIDVYNCIYTNLRDKNKKEFRNKFNFIKRNRILADYECNPISETIAKETLQESEKLNEILEKIYK